MTYHRINGAVLLYLTIGLTFVALLTFIDLLTPHAFSGLSVADNQPLASNLIYFSFVTLTSTGYGDIVPLHPIGQLYPATLLARLVTLGIKLLRLVMPTWRCQPRTVSGNCFSIPVDL